MNEPVAVPISPKTFSEIINSSFPTSDKSELVMDDSTMNHLTYKATNKVPYVVDYFGINDFYETNPMVTEMAKELHKILVDVDSEIQVHQTKDELDALLQEINIQENDAPIYKLRRALEMAKIKARLAEKERFHLQVLADSQRI